MVKNLPTSAGKTGEAGSILGREDRLEKEMTFILAPHINRHVYTSFLSARCKQFLEYTDRVLFILV